MTIILVFIAKKIVQVFNRIGKFGRFGYKYDALIVGNLDYMTVCQKSLIERLDSEKISNHFIYRVEKDAFLAKLIAYARCAYYIAKARNIIVFDYCFPVYCIKKNNNQKVYQLWHANGAFKRFGLPNFIENHGEKLANKLYKLVPIHSNYDYIFVSNEQSMPYYMQAFNDFSREKYFFSNNIFLDMMIESNEKNPHIKAKNEINIILAPTYNYNPQKNIYEQLSEHIEEEANKLGIKANIIYLLHPKLAKNYDKIGIMISSDVLVTDYSSVCFEAAGIGKDVAFLRSDESLDVFTEVAKKAYYNPKELAIDILEGCLINNELTEQLAKNGEKQVDIIIRLIKKL